MNLLYRLMIYIVIVANYYFFFKRYFKAGNIKKQVMIIQKIKQKGH